MILFRCGLGSGLGNRCGKLFALGLSTLVTGLRCLGGSLSPIVTGSIGVTVRVGVTAVAGKYRVSHIGTGRRDQV